MDQTAGEATGSCGGCRGRGHAGAGDGVTRRALLGAAGIGAAAIGLAGCDSGGGGGAGGSGGGPGSRLAATADVPVAGAVVVGRDGQPVVVAQPREGEFVAHSAVCTHSGCTVSATKGLTVECPCHGSVFHAGTGRVERGPAREPLPSVPVRIRGSDILRA